MVEVLREQNRIASTMILVASLLTMAFVFALGYLENRLKVDGRMEDGLRSRKRIKYESDDLCSCSSSGGDIQSVC